MGFRTPRGVATQPTPDAWHAPTELAIFWRLGPRRVSCRRVALVCLFSLAALSGRAFADDPLLKQLFDRQAAAAIQEAKSPHEAPPSADGASILILNDGRVVDGVIRADLHGYRVETPEANLFFTFDQVQLVARDRQDAYQKMCAANPSQHLKRDLRLGRWCLENRLPREAAFHLKKVLEVDPANADAKALLTRLAASQTSGGFVAVGSTAERVVADAKVVESLSRLSPTSVKEFVIGVQPILLARCGSARCHGGGETGTSFRLERVQLAAGGSRSITGRNLESVLLEIDPQFARRSPLFRKAVEAHGGAGRAPLTGNGADLQKARLTAWLQHVGPELNRLNHEDSGRRSVEKIAQAGKPETHRDPLIVPASAITVDHSAAIDVAIPAPSEPVSSAAPKRREKPANDLGPLTDPFDPAQFNHAK
jgi:hypothetical protein